MKTFLKKDVKSVLFVLALTLFGFTLAYMLCYELDDKQKMGAILVLIVSFLTSCSLYFSIYKAAQSHRN